ARAPGHGCAPRRRSGCYSSRVEPTGPSGAPPGGIPASSDGHRPCSLLPEFECLLPRTDSPTRTGPSESPDKLAEEHVVVIIDAVQLMVDLISQAQDRRRIEIVVQTESPLLAIHRDVHQGVKGGQVERSGVNPVEP